MGTQSTNPTGFFLSSPDQKPVPGVVLHPEQRSLGLQRSGIMAASGCSSSSTNLATLINEHYRNCSYSVFPYTDPQFCTRE